jgi:pimeloyl-ACP methyl ester carboxylesterase
VETTTEGDVPLVGYLVEPTSGGRTDAAVLVVHGLTTGPFSPMVKMFLPHYVDHGFTAVAMETRRSGVRCIADSFPENDTADVDAFVELLLARGFTKIVLVGASLGSQAISRYVARRHHPAVVGCVHLAPTGDMPANTVANVDPRELSRVIAEATTAVESGHPEQLVRYDLTEQGPSRYHSTRRTFWRAESWLAWWGPDAPTSHLELISEVDVPVLLLSGTADDYNSPARLDELTAAAKQAPIVDRVWMPADHGLRGAEAAATAEAVAWLERHELVEAAPARPGGPLAPIAGRLLTSHVHPTVEDFS